MLGFQPDGTRNANLRPAQRGLADAPRGDARSGQAESAKRRRDSDEPDGADKRVRFESNDDQGYDTEFSGEDDQGYSTEEPDTVEPMCGYCNQKPAKGLNAAGGFNNYCSGTCFRLAQRGTAAVGGVERQAQPGGVRGRVAGSGGRTAGARAKSVGDSGRQEKLEPGQRAAVLVATAMCWRSRCPGCHSWPSRT